MMHLVWLSAMWTGLTFAWAFIGSLGVIAALYFVGFMIGLAVWLRDQFDLWWRYDVKGRYHLWRHRLRKWRARAHG